MVPKVLDGAVNRSSAYSASMRRFAPIQSDLFAAPPPSAREDAPRPDPLTELTALLARLRAAATPPWPDLNAAIADEYRALGLAREAGAEGAALASAIMDETERLLSMTD